MSSEEIPGIDELEEDEILEVTVDGYGHTGEGYVRLRDGWLSIRGAMPGERVRVRIEPAGPRRSRRRWATLVEVLTPHRERRDPLCELDAICRGCQLRHLSVAEEVRFKGDAIREILARHAGLKRAHQPDLELIAPAPMMRGDAHRIRSTLTYRRLAPDRYELGIHTPAREALVPMRHCAALTLPTQRLIHQVHQALDAFAARSELPLAAGQATSGATLEQIKIATPTHGRGFVLLRAGGDMPLELAPLAEAIAEATPDQVGVFIRCGDHVEHIDGPAWLRLSTAGLMMLVGPMDWFHATQAPAEVLYEELMEWLELEPGERLADIGCGIGTISLLAARRGAQSLGLDASLASIGAAELNAQENNIEGAEFLAGSWENGLRRLMMSGRRFDVATINPMREPLGERALAYLDPLGVERLVYLGPSPVSAARDLRWLFTQGWYLDRLGAAMLHPATYHVMLVARLRRGAQNLAPPEVG